MLSLNMLILFMFFSGILTFSLARKHMLMTLFSLEFLVLVLFLYLFFFLIHFGFELFMLLIYLVFAVCEGALGLGVLVNMVRSHGNDLLSSMSTLSW
nr:NADH dehydrogenase subunit 4L [Leptocoris augur]